MKKPYSGKKAKSGGAYRTFSNKVYGPTKKMQKIADSSGLAKKYIECLLDPIDAASVAIPDMCTYPTVTYSQEMELNFTSASAGPADIGSGGVFVGLAPAPYYAIENGASTTDATFTWAGDTAFTGNTTIQSAYSRHRLVSAGIIVQTTAADQSNGGTMTVAYGTRGETKIASLTAMKNGRDNETHPSKEGGFVRYRPLDMADFDMYASTSTTTNAFFQIHVSGTSSATTFIVKVVLHWEGIPNIDTAFLGSNAQTTGMYDPAALASGLNAAAQAPTSGPARQGENSMRADANKAVSKLYDSGPFRDYVASVITPMFTPQSVSRAFDAVLPYAARFSSTALNQFLPNGVLSDALKEQLGPYVVKTIKRLSVEAAERAARKRKAAVTNAPGAVTKRVNRLT